MGEQDRRFYVYSFDDGCVTLYVGKGSGSRLKAQERRFGIKGKVLERHDDERKAFQRERYWINRLKPTENRNRGGAGGCVAIPSIPANYRGRISLKEWRDAVADYKETEREISEHGSKKALARFLLRKLDERNCDAFGLSKVDVCRLREVAHG